MAGRPSKYKPEYTRQAYELALLGLTDAEMANVFDVKEQTLNNWKKSHSDFKSSLKRGRVVADSKVACKLYERACGYEVEEEVIFHHRGDIVRDVIVRKYPPDTKAIQMWLFNRQRDKWRLNPENDTSEDKPPSMPVSFEDDPPK